VTDGGHGGVHAVHAPARDALADGVGFKAELVQLRERHDAVLRGREPGDRTFQRGVWRKTGPIYVPVFRQTSSWPG